MAIAYVQHKTASEQVGGTAFVVLDSAPTSGNLLVLWQSHRSLHNPSSMPGWTQHPTGTVDGGVDRGSMFWKVSDGTETSIEATADGDRHIATVAEFSGGSFMLDASAETTGTAAAFVTGSVTPTSGSNVVIVGGAVINTGDSPQSVTPGSGWTELGDSMVDELATGGFHPLHWMGYQIVTSASGSYNPTGTATAPGDFGGQTLAFTAASQPSPGYWIDWAGDGFDDGSGPSGSSDDPRLARGLPQAATIGTANGGDNVTSYVLSSTWHRGGSYDHVGANGPGGFTILLDNSTGRFDPDNTASDIFGLMQPGRAVWAGAIADTGAVGTANGTGTVAGFIAGYVREFVPTVDSSGRRVCEVIGEDAFGRYGRGIVSVTPSLTRSHASLRSLILDGLGEASGRRDLDTENGTMPFSAAESENGLALLEELNRATATRHYIRPADTKEDWYDYVTVNKLHKLGDAADQSLDGDDISNVSGWRVTNDNVVEVQRATVVPISLTPDNLPVWEWSDTPATFSWVRPKVINANFDDYIFSASVDVEFSSGSGSASITNYGKTAVIAVWATTPSATISKLRVLGQEIVRGDSITVVAGDETPGALSGSTIASDFIGQTGAAQGLVDFIVWKFGQPLKRPSVTVEGKNAASLSTIFSRDLYDVMSLSIDKLSITTARRLEVVGLRGSHTPGRSGLGIWSVTYELQETPNQSPVEWFDVNSDTINGPAVIAPF